MFWKSLIEFINCLTLGALDYQVVIFVSSFSEIEKSGTVPITKPSETEHSETNCDVGEALDPDAPVQQPSFVSPPERWV